MDAGTSVPSAIDRLGIFIGRPSYPSVLGELGLVGLEELGRLTPMGACTCNTGPPVLLPLGRPALCFARSSTRFILATQVYSTVSLTTVQCSALLLRKVGLSMQSHSLTTTAVTFHTDLPPL